MTKTFRRRWSAGLGGSKNLQLSHWIHWGKRNAILINIDWELFLVTSLFYSQDCGNKLVESGCVSQEEVENQIFFTKSMWCRWTGWKTTRWPQASSRSRTMFSPGTLPSAPLSSRQNEKDFNWTKTLGPTFSGWVCCQRKLLFVRG